jgi:hypothetical protein
MKTPIFKAALILSVFAIAIGIRAAAQPASTNAPAILEGIGPKIQFDAQSYDFGRVAAGTLVKHDFVFTNTGDARLEITGVQPGCGCTTVGEWTHAVEPGKTGVIPIQFNSSAYGGPVTKAPSITCNDKSQPTVRFQLHGTVFKPIDYNPPYVSINIGPDASEEASGVVHIVNNMDHPVTLQMPTSNQRAFTTEVKTNEPGKSYDVIVKTVPPLPSGTSQALITVGTSATNSPSINIFAMVNVQPIALITPQQISLPPGPLKANQTVSVAIRNQGSHPLVLSNPSINAQGATADVSAVDPGKVFNVTATFPAGYEIPAGASNTLSIKTDNPRSPVLEVPIRQPRSPIAPQASK